jgi:hypothetical protein
MKKDESEDFLKKHAEYMKNTQSFRKYGGIPAAGSGKVYNLNAKGKALERKINSPIAKEKRALRNDRYEGHENRFTMRRLAELNRKTR